MAQCAQRQRSAVREKARVVQKAECARRQAEPDMARMVLRCCAARGSRTENQRLFKDVQLISHPF
jgi:hypothetical protein